MDRKNDFKPYISAGRILPELTPMALIVGVLLSVIFGAANAYLGLKVGMTISASIPAAVVGMGVIRVLMRRKSILESNMVQTIGSAGESLAAGAIFTMPALFLWAADGIGAKPDFLEITLIALFGGLLGVFFMVPLRRALIVREHGRLPYPEGMACAEVMMAGEKGGSSAATVFGGMGLGALFKFIVDGLKAVPSEINASVKGFAGQIGTQIYPALIGVGYICGPRISSYMFAGGVVGWLVIIPLIVLFGAGAVIYPGNASIGEIFAAHGAAGIWDNYIRYIGAGAVACGGILSLVKSFPLIVRTFRDAMRGLKGSRGAATGDRTDRDLNFGLIIGAVAVLAVLIWLVPVIPVTLLGAVLIVVFGFFFATVSSRMVGLVGSSNNPVSGMAIATLLIATIVLKATGYTGVAGMTGAIAIGSVICIIAAIAGDTSQDLKTGYILGATPRKQQIGEVIGVTIAAVAIGGVLYLLDAAWKFGSTELPAPQATLMRMIVEGVMDGNLPWALIFVGVFIALVMEILRIPVLPFAVGLYLPVQLNACIMIGGVIRLLMDRRKAENAAEENEHKRQADSGVLYCSGLIAGEGLVGILLAVFALIPLPGGEKLGNWLGQLINLSGAAGTLGAIVLLGLIILSVLKFSVWSKKPKEHVSDYE